jgi:hypothetical protein
MHGSQQVLGHGVELVSQDIGLLFWCDNYDTGWLLGKFNSKCLKDTAEHWRSGSETHGEL